MPRLRLGATFCRTGISLASTSRHYAAYNMVVERKVFWLMFIGLGLLADMLLPLLWGILANIPIAVLSWWIAYRSDWLT
jgi:hypothetical protein